MVVTETPAYEQAINYCKKNIRSVASIFFRLDFILRHLSRRNLMKKGGQRCDVVTIPLPAYLQPHSRAISLWGVGWGMSDQQPQQLSFGVIDRPACPYCGERTSLTRRSPHPDHDLRYELQIFTCSACDHTIDRIVDANGRPPEKLKCCD